MEKTITIGDFDYDVPFVWSQSTVHLRPRMGHVSKGESLTIPDQSMSLRTLLNNHTHGVSPMVAKTPIFDDDESLSSGVNIKTLDLVDLQKMRTENQRLIREVTQQMKVVKKRQEDEIEIKKVEEAKADDPEKH